MPSRRPSRPRERAVAPLIEAPQPLQRHGRKQVVYSAGASWSGEYALGLPTYAGGDPLQARSSLGHPLPVLARNPAAGVWGPGHPSLVRSPDGRENSIVYHATDHPEAGWKRRSVRAQPFGWNADGTPRFGDPVPAGVPIEEPSGTPGPGLGRKPGAEPRRGLRAAHRPGRRSLPHGRAPRRAGAAGPGCTPADATLSAACRPAA